MNKLLKALVAFLNSVAIAVFLIGVIAWAIMFSISQTKQAVHSIKSDVDDWKLNHPKRVKGVCKTIER